MKERIMELLRESVAIPSFTGTSDEVPVERYIGDVLSRMEYFQKNPELFGLYAIPGDHLGRYVAYGLVRGKTDKTVILMNHHDVVGVEDYGFLQPYAFDMDELPIRLAKTPLDDETRSDLESGEWLFGRGTADMKAGLAIELAVLENYSKNPDSGNLLFISVPDEESYSVGMRGAVGLLSGLKTKYALDYRLLLNTEPNKRIDGRHVVSVGTGGKCLPVIVAQGEKAHISMCFDGLNPLSLMTEIYRETELSLEFSDEFNGEITPPPTWNYFRDQKTSYDVSLPLRASGYFSVLSFRTTPEDVLNKLKAIATRGFESYVGRMQKIYDEYRSRSKFRNTRAIAYEPNVMSFQELCDYCRRQDGDGFESFYTDLYGGISKRVLSNELNYPQATLEFINSVMDFSRITGPVVVIGFAPPYYPPVSGKLIAGREGLSQQYFDGLNDFSQQKYGVGLSLEEYMVGITDCSYCAVNDVFDYEQFSQNTPVWGDLYSIDFNAIEQINVVSLILGPWGKDYHQLTERVYRSDVTERVPDMVQAAIKMAFA